MRRLGVWVLALLFLPFALFLAPFLMWRDDQNDTLTGPRFTDED